MPSQKPTQPPTFDEATFAQRLRERVLAPSGQPFSVFKPEYFPKFVRWVRGTEEFDGTGLRDVVNANAIYLDAVKNDLDNHKDVDNLRHAALASRVAALEAQGKPPFPASL